MAGEVILIALAAMKGTEFSKELIPFPLQPWLKSVVAAALCVVLGALTQQRPLVWAGAWGLSAVAHEIRAVLSMISDDKKQQIFLRVGTRRR